MRVVSVIPNPQAFYLPSGPVAVLMIHGFNGSPASIKPWAQGLADLGFSEVPGQHKCGHVIKLDDGNFAIQPNNRCRAFEPSFVTKPGQNVIERKLGTQMWSVENTSKWVLSDDDRYEYEVKENGNRK